MRALTVALLQLESAGYELEAQRRLGDTACRRAKALGADIALFPEMWSNGYTSAVPEGSGDHYRHPQRWNVTGGAALPEAGSVWRGEPVDTGGPFVAHFRALAAELDMAIALTYLERWAGAPRNTVSLIDRYGEIALTQAKVHTCAFALPEVLLTPGDSFRVCTLDTAVGPVVVGAMICYDREFPESARTLMLAGAEVILTPNACDLEANRLTQYRSRAFENMTAMAMANYARPGWGHSIAFDGMAFGSAGSRDMLVVEAGEMPGIYPATFDLDALRDYRYRESLGDAFRRPVAYGPLAGGEVAEPFVRVDRDGRGFPR